MGITVPEHHNHRVQVRLKTRNIWNIDDRVEEVKELRDWASKLTDWDPDAYTMKYYGEPPGGGPIIDVWFRDERHATAFALRWA